ncbi:hypothetical protein IWW45_001367 [Coemansia sp. RSA 485]|nr:hypothetical protein IWW45_001367 [Coemansia sp. RSA 485]
MKQKPEASSGSSGPGGADKKPHNPAYDELMRFYENRIAALKNTRDSLESAKPVLTPPSTPPGSGGSGELQTRSRALLALELLTEMVDDLTMDIVFETHFEAKQSIAMCSNCNTRCQSKTSTPNYPLANYDSSSEQSADRKRKYSIPEMKCETKISGCEQQTLAFFPRAANSVLLSDNRMWNAEATRIILRAPYLALDSNHCFITAISIVGKSGLGASKDAAGVRKKIKRK